MDINSKASFLIVANIILIFLLLNNYPLMKKQLQLIFCLLILGTTACKKQRSELIVSEIRTLNEIKTPGFKEEFLLNQQITFYVIIEKENKPEVVYTLREYVNNSSTIIASGSIDAQYSSKDLTLNYTPTQNKDLITLELTATCGKDLIKRFKYLVAK